MEQSAIDTLIQQHQLPQSFLLTVKRWYQPLARHIMERHKQGQCLVVGVQGSQGSGKSTLASFLCEIIRLEYDRRAVALSMDDFYLSREDRLKLAEEVHPLLVTRGVPGTHDVDLAMACIDALKNFGPDEQIPIPRFNKAVDDRLPKSSWDSIDWPIDVIILEGWCLGVDPEEDSALTNPINELEANEDADGTWRRFVNHALAERYADWFDLIDALVVLNAPSFECVYEWRWLQEQKLAAKIAEYGGDATHLLDEVGVKRFISHYERLTRHCLQSLPQKADWLLPLNHEHAIEDLIICHE